MMIKKIKRGDSISYELSKEDLKKIMEIVRKEEQDRLMTSLNGA